jgi:hypothetical protein
MLQFTTRPGIHVSDELEISSRIKTDWRRRRYQTKVLAIPWYQASMGRLSPGLLEQDRGAIGDDFGQLAPDKGG